MDKKGIYLIVGIVGGVLFIFGITYREFVSFCAGFVMILTSFLFILYEYSPEAATAVVNFIIGLYCHESDEYEPIDYSDAKSTTERKGSMCFVTHIRSREIGDVVEVGWTAEESQANAKRLYDHCKEERKKR